MNILFFLTPKIEVAFAYNHNTLRQGLEKMRHHSYSAIPVIDDTGRYIGTITEGDFLWKIIDCGSADHRDIERIRIGDLLHDKRNQSVNVNSSIEELLLIVMTQNFVPVVDDRGLFIGIITRRDILQYYYNLTHSEKSSAEGVFQSLRHMGKS